MSVVFAGIVATLVADGWQLVLRHLFKLPVSDWAVVGRWVAGFLHGRFVMGSVPPVRFERLIGWTFHYVIGVAYASIFAIVCAPAFAAGRAVLLASALVFGALTVLAPWLLMQPAMGRGAFASRAGPQRGRVLIANMTTHLSFGFGLYIGFESAARLA
jgi:hypothetical protein